MADEQEVEGIVRTKLDEKKIVAEFCQLLDKSRQLFSALRFVSESLEFAGGGIA